MKYILPFIIAAVLASCSEGGAGIKEQYEIAESAAVQRLKSGSGGGTAVAIERLGPNPRSADWSRVLVHQGPKILRVGLMDISNEAGRDYATMEAAPIGQTLGARLTLRLTVPPSLNRKLRQMEEGRGLLLSGLVASVNIDEVQSQIVGDGEGGTEATSVALGSLNGLEEIARPVH